MAFEPEMMFEEIEIAIETGRCPRCGAVLDQKIKRRSWEMSCPSCKTVWGGGS
jgi:predicted Zn-ribbon and HTH transcriptional regulator